MTLPKYVPREYLSYSTLMSFIRCPRRYFYIKSGIYPQDEATALSYGTAMHKAVSIAVTEGLDAGLKAFCSVWDDSMADNKRSISRARAQLSHFVHAHTGGRSLYTMLPAPENPGIALAEDLSPFEIPFAIDIGLPIPLTGRLDGWCMHRDTKDYWAYEFKTTSRLTGAMFESLELNPQVLSYTLVTRTVTGRPIRGVMYEGMLIDPSKVDSVTHPVLIPEHLLDDTLTWLRYWGELLLACEKRYLETNDPAQSFPKNFAGCSAYPQFYMPGSHCDYENLCRVSTWQAMLGYYAIREEPPPVSLTINGASA